MFYCKIIMQIQQSKLNEIKYLKNEEIFHATET